MKKLMFLVLINFMFVMSVFSQSKAFDKIVLFQTNEELNQHGPDVNEFSNYIKKVQDEILNFTKKNNDIGDGFIVVALRPVGKSNVWFDLSGNKKLDSLKNKILAITPCHVQGGAVVFAVTNLDNPSEVLPAPEEWIEVLENIPESESLSITELIDQIWPSEITKKEKDKLLKSISSFKKEKDFSEKTLAKYQHIIEYAVESDLIRIKVEYEDLPQEISKGKYGTFFLLAYICGNLEKQLQTGVYENAREEGIAFELYKYEQLKKFDKTVVFDSFEKMLKK